MVLFITASVLSKKVPVLSNFQDFNDCPIELIILNEENKISSKESNQVSCLINFLGDLTFFEALLFLSPVGQMSLLRQLWQRGFTGRHIC